MIAIDDTSVVPFRKILREKSELRTKDFSLSVPKKIRHLPQMKNWPEPEEEFPVDKWIMPPQPERYLKCSDHDFF